MANKPLGKAPQPLAKRMGPPPEAAQDHEQENDNQPARSKADMFNAATPESGFNVPVGNYVAHLVGAEHKIEPSPSKKEYVQMTYEVAEGEFAEKSITAFYNLFDKDGNPQRGAGFLKRDMALMQGPELDYDQLQEQLDELTTERLLCNLTVKANKGFTNVFFQGLAEG